nr:hypothetical protein [Isoptericola sp. BMS4]
MDGMGEHIPGGAVVVILEPGLDVRVGDAGELLAVDARVVGEVVRDRQAGELLDDVAADPPGGGGCGLVAEHASDQVAGVVAEMAQLVAPSARERGQRCRDGLFWFARLAPGLRVEDRLHRRGDGVEVGVIGQPLALECVAALT